MKFRVLALVLVVALVAAVTVTGAFSSLRELASPAAAEPMVGVSAGLTVPHRQSPSQAPASASASEGERAAARQVLAQWDVRRSAAWAAGSVEQLRALYVSWSAAGEQDVKMLEAWLAKDLRVEGLTMQVLSFYVVTRAPDLLVLQVTDRLAGGVAVGRGERHTLPADRADARTITMVREQGVWLVDSVD